MGNRLCVIVTGDRNADYQTWREVLKEAFSNGEVWGREAILIHGDQRGIDTHAAKVAGTYGWARLPVDADFKSLGKPAGPQRNRDMARIADILQDHGYEVRVYAFHDYLPNSKGTLNMVETAERYGFPVTLRHSDGRKVNP